MEKGTVFVALVLNSAMQLVATMLKLQAVVTFPPVLYYVPAVFNVTSRPNDIYNVQQL